MLPRLEAEETVALAEAVGLGSGAVDERRRQRRLNELQRLATGGASAACVDISTEDGRAMLAVMGIGVEVHHG